MTPKFNNPPTHLLEKKLEIEPKTPNAQHKRYGRVKYEDLDFNSFFCSIPPKKEERWSHLRVMIANDEPMTIMVL